jgi:ribosomal protein L18
MSQNATRALVAVNPSNVPAPVNLDESGNLKVASASVSPASLPTGATQITGGSGSVAAASAVATLAAAAAKTTWITGFTVTAAGATAGASVSLVVSGLLGGSLTYVYTAPAGATVPGPVLNVQFATPLPASAVNTAIAVTLPSLGTGNLAASVVAYGYQV